MKIYQLYTTFLYQSEVYERAMQILSEQEKIFICHIQTEKQRVLSLGAKLLLKYVLAKEGIQQYEIEKGKHGKPFLKEKDLYFNISHTKSCVVCVVNDSIVGIDIETKTRNLPQYYEKILSHDEQIFLKSRKNFDMDFLRIWTMKESFVKMEGGRIFENPNHICMIENMDFRKMWQQKQCFFHSYIDTEYIVSVCAKQNVFPKTMTMVTAKDMQYFFTTL